MYQLQMQLEQVLIKMAVLCQIRRNKASYERALFFKIFEVEEDTIEEIAEGMVCM